MGVLTNLVLLVLLKQCPPKEDIAPCSCVSKKGPEITCTGISAVTLKDTLTRLQEYQLTRLKLNNINFPTIADNLFQNTNIEELVLSKIEVEDESFRPGKRHLKGLENSLTVLDIRNSFRNEHRPLMYLQLGYLTKLDTCIFEDNSIPEVGDEWFSEGPQQLTVLIFERNGIEKLGPNAFRRLDNLKLLAFAGNHIRDVTRSMLPEHASQLMTIDLAYNKIRELPKDIFSNLPSLQGVNLSFNLIHLVKEDVWSPIFSQLNRLHLEGNPLQCDAELNWTCKYNIAGISAKCALPVSQQGKTIVQYCANP